MENIKETPSKETKILHPFAFIIFEIINVYLTVNETATMGYLIRPILILLTLAFIIYKILILILKDKYKSGIITSASIIFIFSFFYFYQFISQTIRIPGILFIAIWIIIYIFIIFATFRFKKNLIKTNKFLNLISMIILLTTLSLTLFLEYKITNYNTSGIFKNKWVGNIESKLTKNNLNISYINNNNKEPNIVNHNNKPNLPDIYYIILDSYERQDGLKYIFKYDNSPFINFLKKKGFYVADKSHSNYNLTYNSLASSLNADYINNLKQITGKNSKNNKLLLKLIQKNRVSKYLKKKGYQIITFDSTYTGAFLKETDEKIGPLFCFSEFETTLLKVSIFSFLLNKTFYNSHYNFINYTLDNITTIGKNKLPKFVFAHILSPHPPFIFKSNGELKTLNYSFNFFDGYYFYSPKKSYKMYLEGYKSQVHYLNQKLKIIIEKIINNSKTQPIIIIQGDHGSGSSYHPGDIKKTNLKERFSILNAYLIPKNAKHLLYDDITPVNTFRVIFNYLFQTKLPLLKDLHFFSTWMDFFEFINVPLK